MARVILVLAMAICIAAINSVAADEAADVSADTVAPVASEETPTPETAEPTPDTSADTEAPMASEETPAPETAEPTPDISADTAAPQGSEETTAPETAEPTPDTSGDTAAPQGSEQTVAPDTAEPTPDISGDTAAPQGSGATPSPDAAVPRPPATTSAPAAQCVRATFTITGGNFNELQQNATEWGMLLEALRRDLAGAGFVVNSLSANTLQDGSLAVTAGWSSGGRSSSTQVLVSGDWLQRVKALYAQVASGNLKVQDVAGQVVACASGSSGELKSASAPVQLVSVAAVAVAALAWWA